ncbi:MAG: [protein-PII] uridylyltransferase [Deferrisomatales bacterium]|nr:[protein-PII] uridylyltransferase [Deferrisomatales bacterium]
MSCQRTGVLQTRLQTRGSRVQEIREYLRCSRSELRTLHDGGGSGHAVVATWTDRCDTLVCALFRSLQEERRDEAHGSALFALGEFGHRALAPHSVLEMLLVHREGFDPMPLWEGLLHPLRDAHLDVQGVLLALGPHRVADGDSPIDAASLGEGRFLCGDPTLTERRDPADRAALPGTSGTESAAGLLAEMEERHARYGGTVYLLEPQVVEGQGGLRDIQTALLAVRRRFGARTVDELLQNGLVPAAEIRALEESREFLLRLRNQLHFLCGRREDRLSFELQAEVAEYFGHPDTPQGPGAEALLQGYYACANQVVHAVERLLRKALSVRGNRGGASGGEPPQEVSHGVLLQGGEITLDPLATTEDPLRMLAAFEAAQVHDADLSAQATQVIRDHLDCIDDRYRRDPDAVALFLRVLQYPRRVASTLFCMHDVRFLDRFIPELEPIYHRVQRDPYHAYPVDVHSLFAVQELRRLARGEYREEFPQYTRAMEEVERPHLVYLAALLHDVGKGHGSRHEERGAELAIQVADRMDLLPRERAHLEFLVREHLSLALTAQSRDLHDEQLVAEFAGHVGDPQLLRMLHLLTFADARAVGPTSWTRWKHLLFRELYEKSLAVLEHGPPRRDITAERVAAVGHRLRAAAGDLAPEAEVEGFLAHIDDPRYLLAQPVEVLLRHLAAFLGRGDVPVVELRAVPAEGHTELLLLTRDRPGLFATVAGLLATHQVNVLSAVLNTRTDGWAVDVFHVTVPRGEPLASGPRWDQWREELVHLLSGSGALPPLKHRCLRVVSPLEQALPPVPTRVTVDNNASARFTVVDLSGPDRLGLLYDVARALTDQGLTIRLAKIITMLRRVSDAFYVETVEGGKLTDAGRLIELQHRLEAVIAGATREGEQG